MWYSLFVGRPKKPEIANYVSTSIRLPPELHKALRLLSFTQSRLMNDVLIDLVRSHVEMSDVNQLVQAWKDSEAGPKDHIFDVLLAAKEH
jgi:hypothetical protein